MYREAWGNVGLTISSVGLVLTMYQTVVQYIKLAGNRAIVLPGPIAP